MVLGDYKKRTGLYGEGLRLLFASCSALLVTCHVIGRCHTVQTSLNLLAHHKEKAVPFLLLWKDAILLLQSCCTDKMLLCKRQHVFLLAFKWLSHSITRMMLLQQSCHFAAVLRLSVAWQTFTQLYILVPSSAHIVYIVIKASVSSTLASSLWL